MKKLFLNFYFSYLTILLIEIKSQKFYATSEAESPCLKFKNCDGTISKPFSNLIKAFISIEKKSPSLTNATLFLKSKYYFINHFHFKSLNKSLKTKKYTIFEKISKNFKILIIPVQCEKITEFCSFKSEISIRTDEFTILINKISFRNIIFTGENLVYTNKSDSCIKTIEGCCNKRTFKLIDKCKINNDLNNSITNYSLFHFNDNTNSIEINFNNCIIQNFISFGKNRFKSFIQSQNPLKSEKFKVSIKNCSFNQYYFTQGIIYIKSNFSNSSIIIIEKSNFLKIYGYKINFRSNIHFYNFEFENSVVKFSDNLFYQNSFLHIFFLTKNNYLLIKNITIKNTIFYFGDRIIETGLSIIKIENFKLIFSEFTSIGTNLFIFKYKNKLFAHNMIISDSNSANYKTLFDIPKNIRKFEYNSLVIENFKITKVDLFILFYFYGQYNSLLITKLWIFNLKNIEKIFFARAKCKLTIFKSIMLVNCSFKNMLFFTGSHAENFKILEFKAIYCTSLNNDNFNSGLINFRSYGNHLADLIIIKYCKLKSHSIIDFSGVNIIMIINFYYINDLGWKPVINIDSNYIRIPIMNISISYLVLNGSFGTLFSTQKKSKLTVKYFIFKLKGEKSLVFSFKTDNNLILLHGFIINEQSSMLISNDGNYGKIENIKLTILKPVVKSIFELALNNKWIFNNLKIFNSILKNNFLIFANLANEIFLSNILLKNILHNRKIIFTWTSKFINLSRIIIFNELNINSVLLHIENNNKNIMLSYIKLHRFGSLIFSEMSNIIYVENIKAIILEFYSGALANLNYNSQLFAKFIVFKALKTQSGGLCNLLNKNLINLEFFSLSDIDSFLSGLFQANSDNKIKLAHSFFNKIKSKNSLIQSSSNNFFLLKMVILYDIHGKMIELSNKGNLTLINSKIEIVKIENKIEESSLIKLNQDACLILENIFFKYIEIYYGNIILADLRNYVNINKIILDNLKISKVGMLMKFESSNLIKILIVKIDNVRIYEIIGAFGMNFKNLNQILIKFFFAKNISSIIYQNKFIIIIRNF